MAQQGVSVTVKGDVECERDLHAVADQLDDLHAFEELANAGERIVAGLTPTRTGRLAGSTRGEHEKNQAFIWQGSPVAPYAGPINYGWPRRNIAAAAQMQRADRVLEPLAVDKVEDEINREIQKRGFA